jgi:chromosome segregation ATPase
MEPARAGAQAEAAPGRAQQAGTNIAREYQKRKQLEDDALRMRNRLLQLERHARKMAQRIARTKQRTRDILCQRERNAARAEEKRQHCEERARGAQRQRQQIARCDTPVRRWLAPAQRAPGDEASRGSGRENS